MKFDQSIILQIGDVLETGPPRTGNRSAAIANKNNNTNLNSGQSGLDDSDDSSTHSRYYFYTLTLTLVDARMIFNFSNLFF